jgi:hypothetical protein
MKTEVCLDDPGLGLLMRNVVHLPRQVLVLAMRNVVHPPRQVLVLAMRSELSQSCPQQDLLTMICLL